MPRKQINIGMALRERRKNLKMTQRELSANTGVPVHQISQLEQGNKIPLKHSRVLVKAVHEMALTMCLNNAQLD